MRTDKTLDIRGVAGKRAVQLAREVLGPMRSGQVLNLVTEDQRSHAEIAAFCSEEGYVLLDAAQSESSYAFLIQR